MASLLRPTKRQKQDHVRGDTFTKSTVPKVNSCLDSVMLLPLVERFAGTHFTCSDNLIEIIGKIRSHTYFFECTDLRGKTSNLNNHDKLLSIRKLHGTLILYIGFLLGSQKQMPITSGRWEEVLSALVFCLRDLYTSNNGKLSKFIVEEELNELFILVPNILLCLSSEGFSKEVNVSQETIRQTINISCYQIMKSWLNAPILLKKVLTKSTTTALENFLFGLLKSKNTNIITGTTKQDDSLEVLEKLRPLCDDNSEIRKLLDVTLLVIQSQPLSSCDHLSPRLNIFYWRCVSCVMFGGETKTEKNTDIEIADRAVDSMMPYSTSNNRILSRQAVACIGEFIQISSYDRHKRLIQFATKTILEANPGCDERSIANVKDSMLIQTLECLGLCMKRSSANNFFLQMKGWEKCFDNLVHLAEDDKDTNVTEKATIALIPILEALVTSSEHYSPKYFQKSINIVVKLISLHHAWIVGKTVELLFTVLQNSETRRRIGSSTLLPDLVNALGVLASKNFFVEDSQKAKLAQAFSILIDKIRIIHFLARKSSNLALLVRLTNGSYCETGRSRVQEISIYTILKLARNPCNQRILAKEPGLLSSLIRYTRMTPDDSEVFNERSISRKELKDRILLIANAL